VRIARDSDAIRSYHPRMPMWRCPHCGTPQAEAARCWVCRRSTTACATCRHFRRSVAAQLGYCGLDVQRRPLRGDEIRGCWEASGTPAEAVPGTGLRPSPGLADDGPDRTPVRRLEFVEVRSASVRPRTRTASAKKTAAAMAATGAPGCPEVGDDDAVDPPLPILPVEPGWSLWGDIEP